MDVEILQGMSRKTKGNPNTRSKDHSRRQRDNREVRRRKCRQDRGKETQPSPRTITRSIVLSQGYHLPLVLGIDAVFQAANSQSATLFLVCSVRVALVHGSLQTPNTIAERRWAAYRLGSGDDFASGHGDMTSVLDSLPACRVLPPYLSQKVLVLARWLQRRCCAVHTQPQRRRSEVARLLRGVSMICVFLASTCGPTPTPEHYSLRWQVM